MGTSQNPTRIKRAHSMMLYEWFKTNRAKINDKMTPADVIAAFGKLHKHITLTEDIVLNVAGDAKEVTGEAIRFRSVPSEPIDEPVQAAAVPQNAISLLVQILTTLQRIESEIQLGRRAAALRQKPEPAPVPELPPDTGSSGPLT